MSNIDVGIDFGITNSDIVTKSGKNLSFISQKSEKNIHLSLNSILKNLQKDSKIKNVFVTGGRHLDLPNNFDGLNVIKKNEVDCIGSGARKLSVLDSNFLVLSCGSGSACVAHQNKISIKPLIGPSSILLALMASGLNGQKFQFHGYLPINSSERINALKKLKPYTGSHIFIETPYRNQKVFDEIIRI